MLKHHAGAAQQQVPAIHRAGDAAARHRLHVACERNGALAHHAHYGLGQGMLAALLQGRRQRQQIGRVATGGNFFGQYRTSLGQRACFVEGHHLDGTCHFQRFGILDQNARSGSHAGASHDRRWVANPSAHGHAITSTATALRIAWFQSPVPRPQPSSVSRARPITTGTKIALTRSTVRWIGAFLACASSTRRMIRDKAVSAPMASVRTRMRPSPLMAPPVTRSPSPAPRAWIPR